MSNRFDADFPNSLLRPGDHSGDGPNTRSRSGKQDRSGGAGSCDSEQWDASEPAKNSPSPRESSGELPTTGHPGLAFTPGASPDSRPDCRCDAGDGFDDEASGSTDWYGEESADSESADSWTYGGFEPAAMEGQTPAESVDDIVPESSFRTGHVFMLPAHYEENYQYPLVVWLHDDGNNETQLKQVMPHISLRNYVSVGVRATRAADAAGHRFDWSLSKAAIHQAYDSIVNLVDECSERFSIHPDRVVLAGYRSGGSVAMQIALRDPNRFGGVVSMGGYLPRGGHAFARLAELRQRRMPMLWQWGIDNPDFSVDRLGEDINSVQIAQPSLQVRQYTIDTEMTREALSDVDSWIMNTVVAGKHDTAADSAPRSGHDSPFSGN